MIKESVKPSIALAKEILLQNNRGGYTIPSARLYPFQWNWDSGFIALGLAYFDAQKAMDEIRFMYKGQWENGMLPHIVFHQPNDNYFPGPSEWGTVEFAKNENNIPVSGITQPPVFGFILEKMHLLLKDKEPAWIGFLQEIFPKVVKQHKYFYTQRDPNNEGLVYIQHNWESGTDNSPQWDEIYASMDISNARDVAHLRKDNKNVDSAERPTNDNYKQYIHIVDTLKSCNYNDQQIAEKCPFLVQDILFNSILVTSNNSLITIGEELGLDVTDIKQWNKKTIAAINQKLWDQETGFYYSYDLRNNKRIFKKVSSGFAPLFAGIASTEQADQLAHHLGKSFSKNEDWKLCPSCAVDEPSFNPVKYWRGPAWININWMIYLGLQQYNKTIQAEKLYNNTIELIEESGMYEYFDPRPNGESNPKRGIGADAFSWTAALYLDLIHQPQTA